MISSSKIITAANDVQTILKPEFLVFMSFSVFLIITLIFFYNLSLMDYWLFECFSVLLFRDVLTL